MSTREDTLVCSVLEVIDQSKAWKASDERQLSDELMGAIDDCILLFETGDIPADCKDLFRIAERMKKEWEDFEQYVSGREPAPRASFWKCINEMETAITYAAPPVSDFYIESIETLVRQNVSHRQIAIMYSHDGKGPFMTPGNPPQPNIKLVVQEIEKPGSVLGDDFEHPRLTCERDIARRYENRLARKAEQLRSQKAEFEAEDTAPIGPESIEELIRQGVHDNQIMTIKRCTLDEILQARERMHAAKNGGSSQSTPTVNDAEAEEQIAEYLTQYPDAKNADIAKSLNVSARAVAAARRKLTEKQSTAA